MLNSFNLTILKVECFDEVIQPTCRIFEDNVEKDEVLMSSPLVHTVSIEKPNVKIEVSDLNLAVSFNANLIQKAGFYLLPLFDYENELEEIPLNVPVPRIFLNIYPRIFSPIMELTESSDMCDEFTDINIEDIGRLKSKNIDLKMKVIDLENQLKFNKENNRNEVNEICERYKEKVKDLSNEIEKLRVIQSKNLKISSDIIKENDSLKQATKDLENEKETAIEKLNRFIKLNEDVRLREASILKILESKDKEIASLKKSKVPDSLSTQKQYSFGVREVKNLDFKEKKVFAQFGDEHLVDRKMKNLQDLHRDIIEYTKFVGLEGLVVLNEELTFSVGNKKFSAFSKNDSVYIRHGSLLKNLESFIINNCAQDVISFKLKKKKSESKFSHKKSNTVDIDKFENIFTSKTFDSDPKRISGKLPSFRKSLSRSRNTLTSIPKVLSARNINLY